MNKYNADPDKRTELERMLEAERLNANSTIALLWTDDDDEKLESTTLPLISEPWKTGKILDERVAWLMNPTTLGEHEADLAQNDNDIELKLTEKRNVIAAKREPEKWLTALAAAHASQAALIAVMLAAAQNNLSAIASALAEFQQKMSNKYPLPITLLFSLIDVLRGKSKVTLFSAIDLWNKREYGDLEVRILTRAHQLHTRAEQAAAEAAEEWKRVRDQLNEALPRVAETVSAAATAADTRTGQFDFQPRVTPSLDHDLAMNGDHVLTDDLLAHPETIIANLRDRSRRSASECVSKLNFKRVTEAEGEALGMVDPYMDACQFLHRRAAPEKDIPDSVKVMQHAYALLGAEGDPFEAPNLKVINGCDRSKVRFFEVLSHIDPTDLDLGENETASRYSALVDYRASRGGQAREAGETIHHSSRPAHHRPQQKNGHNAYLRGKHRCNHKGSTARSGRFTIPHRAHTHTRRQT